MRKILIGVPVALVVLLAVIIIRTIGYAPEESAAAQPISVSVDADAIARHMSEAITFETISYQPPKAIDEAAFEAFIAWMAATYPRAHAAMALERVAGHTLLYRWAGSDPALKPVLLTAHYDVVPVIAGTEAQWEQPPFSGAIAEGQVWGRGALDDKSGVITMMEAAEGLLAEGFAPARTIYFSFGHDEEIGGPVGAAGVADLLESRNVELAWSLDEGSFVMDGVFPGVDKPIASINVAEKGYVTIDLIAHAAGGHSSMPPEETAVGILSEAIVRLQDAPLAGGIDGVTADFFDGVAPNMSFGTRVLFANRWLFGGILESVLGGSATGNAMIRTTTAPTMLKGSEKENVLPITAVATVNFRLHPRDTGEQVIEHVRRAIDDDRVEIRVDRITPASKVSSSSADGYVAIADVVRAIYGDVIIAPGMTVGGTDSKHYGRVADDAYRFNPMMVTPDVLATFHGTNERISIDNLVRATVFYSELLTRTAGAPAS